MSDTAVEPQEEQTDVIEPKVADNPVVIGLNETRMVFIQRPLSFFAKMELFSVLAATVDNLMKGEDGISLDQLLEIPDRTEGEVTLQDIADAEYFLQAIFKIVAEAPEVLEDVYCIALGVPRGRRDIVKRLMTLPVEEGGLNDEDGTRIFETFIDQNAEALVSFFVDHAVPAIKRAMEKLGPRFRPSKPSNRTQRRTQKQSRNA